MWEFSCWGTDGGNTTLNADVAYLNPALNKPTASLGSKVTVRHWMPCGSACVRVRTQFTKFSLHIYEQLHLILPRKEKLSVRNCAFYSPLLNSDLMFMWNKPPWKSCRRVLLHSHARWTDFLQTWGTRHQTLAFKSEIGRRKKTPLESDLNILVCPIRLVTCHE